jgi:hypothetical protein
MAVFYFRSPDYDLSGNIKVELTELPSKRFNTFDGRYLNENEKLSIIYNEIKTIDVVEIRVNDGEPIVLETDPDYGYIPEYTLVSGGDWEIKLDVAKPFSCNVNCTLEEQHDIIEIDRVVGVQCNCTDFEDLSFVEWKEAQKEHADYIRNRFKADLVELLNRYNNKRINRKGSLTERIQRIYKQYYGHTVPAFKISDLGVK